jgi:predicted AlkP superfamily pyrophosphatase or phosphodiesterase
MIRPLAALALVTLPVALVAQPAPPPKLLVVIAVDQFSADLFAEYRGHFTGGLKRLSQGVVFPSGYQSQAATETCPGHSTILTGARPARTGIVANSWVDQTITARKDTGVYCAEDVSKGKSSGSRDYVPSPVHLLVPTLGDRMKVANPASRVVAVAGKDRAAIMMGGHKTDQIWFLNPRDYAKFETLATQTLAAPAAVTKANAEIDAALAQPMAPYSLSPLCRTRARTVAISPTKSVGTGEFARAAGDKRAFRTSPESDAATLALAGDLIAEMKLGKGKATDLIAVGVSATDVIGHAYGTEGSEMCLQLEALDVRMGEFFDRLDKAKIDYAVVLTADHGGHDTTERNDENGIPDAQRVEPALSAAAIGTAVGREMGLAMSVLVGNEPSGDMWIDATLTTEQRATALAKATALYKANPQVEAVYSAAEIEAAPEPDGPPETWSLIDRVKASYFRGRSGDFYVILKPRVMPIPAAVAAGNYVATHGSVWDYDRRVPMLFWRRGIAGFEQPNGVETVDIAPTLAGLIGLPIAKSEIDGRCLDLIAGAASSCPAN